MRSQTRYEWENGVGGRKDDKLRVIERKRRGTECDKDTGRMMREQRERRRAGN